jgi:hypothetical protein
MLLSTLKHNCVLGLQKFQAPIHKLQIISKFELPMIQTCLEFDSLGFDVYLEFGA